MSLRFESVAYMPSGMRKKVTPVMLEKALRERRGQKPVQIDGVKFSDGRTAARYLYLMDAAELGIIKELRIRERITVSEPFVNVGGVASRGVFYISDFSYVVADFDYRDGFRADDLADWEGISENLYHGRVYEFMEPMNAEAKERLRGKQVLFKEVPA